jgi:hypothetical protein
MVLLDQLQRNNIFFHIDTSPLSSLCLDILRPGSLQLILRDGRHSYILFVVWPGRFSRVNSTLHVFCSLPGIGRVTDMTMIFFVRAPQFVETSLAHLENFL